MVCSTIPSLPIALPADIPGCCSDPSCPECVGIILPASFQADFGATFLDNSCGAAPWSPGILTLTKTNLGTSCEYVFGVIEDNAHWARLRRTGGVWEIQVSNTGAPQAITTSWYVWTSPAGGVCDPTGVYGGPFSTSICLGGSFPNPTVTIS